MNKLRKTILNINSIDDNNNEILNKIYNDYELYSLSYKDAIEYDKRNILSYYISLIKTKKIL